MRIRVHLARTIHESATTIVEAADVDEAETIVGGLLNDGAFLNGLSWRDDDSYDDTHVIGSEVDLDQNAGQAKQGAR